jgi:RND family efflux transporter MFP subunit
LTIISLILPSLLAQMPPTKVEVATVEERDVAPTIRLVGTVRPQLRSTVASEVAGLVAELPAAEGSAVKRGQKLCQLRDNQRRFALDEAKASLAEMTDVIEERAAMRSKAEFEARRMDDLSKQERSTSKENNDAAADFAAADGRHKQALHAVEAQKARVQRMEDDLARMEILAPFDGFVVMKRTEVGSWVEQGGAIADMVDISTVRVRVSVPEQSAPFCQAGDVADVFIDALRKNFTGKIARRIPDADMQARTFPVEIDIANPKGELLAGMFAQAAVPSAARQKMLVVPKDAIVLREPMRTIFVVRDVDNKTIAQPLTVEVIAEVADHVAVRATGLTAGDRVVTRGNEYMFGPTPVIVQLRQAAASQPTADRSVPGPKAGA